MWKRNLIFIALCSLGFGLLTAAIFPERRSQRFARQDIAPGSVRRADADRDRSASGRARAAAGTNDTSNDAVGFAKTLQAANAAIAAEWESADVTPAPPADSLTIARRLSLGLAGTIPSLEEIRELETVPVGERADYWVGRLLSDRRCSDYVAERLARTYVGTEDGPFLIFRRRRFVQWLSDQLLANRPYDEIVTDLISDVGLWTDSPAVNFLTVTQNDEIGRPDEIRLAARTTRAFLGVRLDCMQCHDDNLEGEWLQSDFHQLAAFYSESTQGFSGIRDQTRNYEYMYLDEEESKVVEPDVPFAKSLLGSEGSRRARLAAWVTHPENEAFSRTVVNRCWAILFGTPLVTPIDHIPLDDSPPALLDVLAKDFIAHDCDLHRLFRLIAATAAFQRESRHPGGATHNHERTWAVFPVTRLRPEQVAGSLIQSATIKSIDAEAHVLVRLARFLEQDEFVKRYGDTGEDEFGEQSGTIPQRLLMMNGKLLKERTKDDFFRNSATQIAGLAHDRETAVDNAYLCVLGRYPTAEESTYFSDKLENREQSKAKEMEDICWALLNSSEFLWNH